VQEAMRQLLESLVAEKRPAEHQQRRDCPRGEGADQQCRRHQDRLVAQRPFGHSPYHWQLAVSLHAGYLLGVEGEVVAQHPRGFLCRDLCHDRHIVEHGRNIIDQRKQAAGQFRSPSR